MFTSRLIIMLIYIGIVVVGDPDVINADSIQIYVGIGICSDTKVT